MTSHQVTEYLNGVMSRLSMGGLIALLVLLLICLLIATIRSSKATKEQNNKPVIPCPTCGQEIT